MEDPQRWERLEAAVRDAVETRSKSPAELRSAARGARGERSTRTLVLVLLLLWAVIGWIWSTKPGFIFGVAAPEAQAPAVEEATLRFALFLERGRVGAYVRRHGQVPAALGSSGAVEDGVTLVRTSDGFVLVGQRGDIQLRLNDKMDADSFLGGSLEVLRQAEQPRR